MATESIKSNNWKLAGKNTGGNGVSVPSGWHELLVRLSKNNGLYTFCWNVVYDANATDQYLRAGFFRSSSDNAAVVAHLDGDTVTPIDFYTNGTQAVTGSELSVYYR